MQIRALVLQACLQHTTIYVSSYYYICVLILLHMCVLQACQMSYIAAFSLGFSRDLT